MKKKPGVIANSLQKPNSLIQRALGDCIRIDSEKRRRLWKRPCGPACWPGTGLPSLWRIFWSNLCGLKYLNFSKALSKALVVGQKRSSKPWLHQLGHLKINIMRSAKLILARALPLLQCSEAFLERCSNGWGKARTNREGRQVQPGRRLRSGE